MTEVERFREAYAAGLRGYLLVGGEGQLRIAYELGRTAVERELGVLELADAHHEALVAAVRAEQGGDEIERVTRAAGDFLRESLSAFEMVQRGFHEAREGAITARHHAAMVRRLSDLLADGSLARDRVAFADELLVLLAEEARELVQARACLVTVAGATPGSSPAGASWDDADAGWSELLAHPSVRALADLIPPHSRALRLSGDELSRCPAMHALALVFPRAVSWRSCLAAPLRTLDGCRLGAIQLFDKRGAGFSEADEDVVVHLAQMASAALERRGWTTV
jgi:GAF domain-containing protein